jgi:arylsulfatase A-like enzyme/Flp pilus assembly protein TadD
VLVSIDTLRADHVGCYGAPKASTPTLDALAARGTRFETAISPAPLTLPSHATLLSGLDPPEHGVRNNGSYRLRDEIPTLAERMHEAGFATAAFVSAFVLDRRFGLARGFDHYDDRLGVQDEEIGVAARPAGQTVDSALAWLESAPKRFFLFLHLYDPHAPYEPPEPHRSRHLGRPYDGEVAYADAELGRLLAAVSARFPDGRSLVAITADHGESLGEHGEPTHAFTLYDATQRVPLLLAGPGVPSGLVVSQLARLADVTPTLLELAGLRALETATGVSLLPALEGEPDPGPGEPDPGPGVPDPGQGRSDPGPGRPSAEPAVAWVETLATQLELGWSPLLGVRTADHKYLRAPRPELYELASDPGETQNLALQQPELAARLDALVSARSAQQRVARNLGLDAETAERLGALGYLADERPLANTRPLGEVGGPDPKDEMGKLETLRELLTLLKQRQGRKAFARFSELGELGPELELLRGEAALQAGDLDAARSSVARALAAADHTAAPLLLRGRIEEAAGQREGAEAAFHEALRLDPEAGAALVGLGRVAEERADVAGARALYERARELRRIEAEALWRLAALELESGEADRARAALAALPQGIARTPPAAARLARAERAAGRRDLALLRVRGSLRDHPEDFELLGDLGDLLEDEGDLDGALEARRRAYDAAPHLRSRSRDHRKRSTPSR